MVDPIGGLREWSILTLMSLFGHQKAWCKQRLDKHMSSWKAPTESQLLCHQEVQPRLLRSSGERDSEGWAHRKRYSPSQAPNCKAVLWPQFHHGRKKHPAELSLPRNHCCLKSLSFRVVCWTAVYNWNTLKSQKFCNPNVRGCFVLIVIVRHSLHSMSLHYVPHYISIVYVT